MNKQEFLDMLEKKILILEESERNDIRLEYSSHIDEKVKKGMSEEEAIKDFGDINTLAKEILGAYKVSSEYADKTKKSKTVDEYASEAGDFFSKFVDSTISFFKDFIKEISNKSEKDIASLVFEILIILFIIFLLKFPFFIVERFGLSILNIFDGILYDFIAGIWMFVINLIYLIVAIVLFVNTIKNRYTKVEAVKVDNKEEVGKKTKKTKKDSESIQELKEEEKLKTSVTKQEEVVIRKEQNIVLRIIILICKVFIVMLLLPCVFFVFGLFVTLGIFIKLLTMGIPVVGFTVLIVGMIVITTTLVSQVTTSMFRGASK